VVTPISNDKILPSDSTSRSISDNKSTGQSELTRPDSVATPSTQDEATSTKDYSLDVERANQIFSQSQASSREDSISTADQARSAAAELSVQIAGNSTQALQAQAGPASANLSALLEAAPT